MKSGKVAFRQGKEYDGHIKPSGSIWLTSETSNRHCMPIKDFLRTFGTQASDVEMDLLIDVQAKAKAFDNSTPNTESLNQLSRYFADVVSSFFTNQRLADSLLWLAALCLWWANEVLKEQD